MDIELYNYIDLLFYNFRSGKLDTNQIKEVKEIKYKEEPVTKSENRLNAGVVC